MLIGLVLSLTSCGIIKQQSGYLKNLRKNVYKKTLTLNKDINFKQTRGMIKTEYYAFAGKGDYSLVFESDSGFYFYAATSIFRCEDNEVGGLFMTKDHVPSVYLWTSFVINEDKFKNNITELKYVSRLKNFTNAKRPFVHWYYEVESEAYTLE